MLHKLCSLARFGLRNTPKHPIVAATLLNSVRGLHASPVLCAEPLKKKKKIDPAVIKARDDRRKKKIEKQIRRLEKNARQLKAIDELEVPLVLIDEKAQRTRKVAKLSEETIEYRALLEKQWSKYMHEEKMKTFHNIDRLVQAQTKALDELRLESEELYQAAVQPDANMLPFKAKMVVATPPITDYDSPDGEYVDISKKWE